MSGKMPQCIMLMALALAVAVVEVVVAGSSSAVSVAAATKARGVAERPQTYCNPVNLGYRMHGTCRSAADFTMVSSAPMPMLPIMHDAAASANRPPPPQSQSLT